MTMPPATDGTPTRMRATHADREHVVGIIEASVADGALTPDEGAERIQAVRAAVFRDEFAVFLADLPAAAPTPVPAAAFATSAPAPGRLRGFVARNRVLSWVLAALLVLVVIAGGLAIGFEGFGGGDHHDRGGTHGQLHDRGDH